MCAIYVLTGKSITPAEAELAFYRTVSRGPDMSNFSETEEGYVGFHRLAIMGLNAAGMQPFYRGGSFVVCNGELYGFRKIKRELEKMGYTLLEGHAPTKSGDVAVGQFLAYNFKDQLRPAGYNMIDRWSGGWDPSGELADVPPPYFDAMKATYTMEIEAQGNKFSVTVNPTAMTKEDYSKGSETSDGIIVSLADLRKLLDKAQGNKKKAVPYDSVMVKVSGINMVDPVEKEIKAMGYSTESMESIRKPMEKEARQKQMMLGGLGAISLFVAALGITNTMIMSISERTREIGIMKSLGCYVTDIRVMFLSEAGAIGLIGGLIGCVISFIVSVIINLVSLGPSLENLIPAIVGGENINRVSVIPPWLLLFAIVFSVFIGLGSGYYPANKAVQIPALEAIKSE